MLRLGPLLLLAVAVGIPPVAAAVEPIAANGMADEDALPRTSCRPSSVEKISVPCDCGGQLCGDGRMCYGNPPSCRGGEGADRDGDSFLTAVVEGRGTSRRRLKSGHYVRAEGAWGGPPSPVVAGERGGAGAAIWAQLTCVHAVVFACVRLCPWQPLHCCRAGV